MIDNTVAPPADKPAPKGKRGEQPPGSLLLKAIRRALGGVLLIALGLGGYLWFYASHQRAYMTGRNHRVLVSLSTQVGEKLGSTEQLINSARLILTKEEVDSAAAFVPAYKHLALRGIPAATKIAPNAEACAAAPVDTMRTDGKWRHDPRAPVSCLYRIKVFSEKSKRDTVLAYLNLATYLKDDFQPRVFDKAVIVDTAGRVLVEAGSPAIVLSRLDAIVKGLGADSSASWSRLSVGSSVGEAKLAGKTYRFFLEPCCRLSNGSSWDQPLLIAGLVDNGKFMRDSLRISLSLLANISAVLILMVLAWPFLKFRLMGERQPVRLIDGVYLGIAGFLAAGLITICLFDLYAYGRFRAGRDEALRALAEEISTNLKHEVNSARAELATLYLRASQRGETREGPERRTIRKAALVFPFFESWSLIDSGGKQVRKWSTDAYVQPLIPVKDRVYFRAIKERRGWTALSDDSASRPRKTSFYLESTVSRTTGKRQAALAIPAADPATPVASMALELLSLIGVVLPPGYGFAVVDEAGQVLFHSDATRNRDESFFSEADDNRRLLSAIAARAVDTLNIRYGGIDHRAYVTPLLDLPWTLVTFLDKEPGRITNAESLLSSVYLLLVYTVALTAFGALVLMLVPGYRVPWLWPDRRLSAGYVHARLIIGLFLSAFLIAFLGLERDDLLSAGFTLPIAAIAAIWTSLTQSAKRTTLLLPQAVVVASSALLGGALLRSDVAGWPHMAVYAVATVGSFLALKPPAKQPDVATSITQVYLTGAALFILIAGAMPAATFFRIAFTAHNEMLIKGAQLHLAKRLEHRADSISLVYSDNLGLGKSGAMQHRVGTQLDLYYKFFGTTLARTWVGDSSPPPSAASASLVALFLAPYRPEASVGWRGTHRSRAADGSWRWENAGDRLQFRGSPAPGGQRIALNSAVVGLLPETFDDWLVVALVAGLVLALAWGIAVFVARRLFLIDVTDPVIISRERRIASVGGTNLFVVCRDAAEESRISLSRASKPFDLRRRLRKDGDLRWLVGKVAEGDLVLLRHFEYLHSDEATTKAKVGLLDALVHEYNCDVVVLSGEHRDGSPLGLRAAWKLIEANGQDQSPAAEALESLVVVDAGRWLDCPPTGERRLRKAPSGSASTVEAIMAEESRCDRHLAKIWNGLQQTLDQQSQSQARQSREELLDVMGERAEVYYRDLWESCRPAERSVLVHLARSGLVNENDRRILRRLLARGLIRRQPNFVLMNETFRRYVLAREAEVEAEVPPQPSTWDAVRQPVLMVGTALVILLFVTQQELFSATAATVAALGTGVATLSKITGLFDRRSPGKAGE